MSNENKSLWTKLSDKGKEAFKFLQDEVKALKVEMNEVPTPVKMGELVLKDGTQIKYTGEKLDVGSEVIVVTPEGETPAPEGDHILEDGSVMTITVQDGKSVVAAIKPAEAPAEMETEVDRKVSERVTKIVEKFEAQFKAQDDLNKKQKIEIENLKLKLGKLSATVIKTNETLIEFAEIETADPIEKPVVDTTKMSKKEKLVNKLS